MPPIKKKIFYFHVFYSIYPTQIGKLWNYTCLKLNVYEITHSNFDLKIIPFDSEKNSNNCDVFINIEIFQFHWNNLSLRIIKNTFFYVTVKEIILIWLKPEFFSLSNWIIYRHQSIFWIILFSTKPQKNNKTALILLKIALVNIGDDLVEILAKININFFFDI